MKLERSMIVLSYVFVFLIALFKDLPLLFGISDRFCSLGGDITYAIGGDNGDDRVVSTRDSNIRPAVESMLVLSRVGDTVILSLLSDYGGSS